MVEVLRGEILLGLDAKQGKFAREVLTVWRLDDPVHVAVPVLWRNALRDQAANTAGRLLIGLRHPVPAPDEVGQQDELVERRSGVEFVHQA